MSTHILDLSKELVVVRERENFFFSRGGKKTVSNVKFKNKCLRFASWTVVVADRELVVVKSFHNSNNIVMLHLHFGANCG
jgi:hypothetical protein